MSIDRSIDSRSERSQSFEWFAAFLLGYLLCVIVFGAWVRVTGSGAGCGEHWPTCHGVLVPRAPSQATLIEYGHRLSSGMLGLTCLALPIWAFRRFPRGHAARPASLATLVLVVVEAAIGARLVLEGLVADDASLSRAVAVALHLVNTLLLTASAALTLAAARQTSSPPLGETSRGLGAPRAAPREDGDGAELGVSDGARLTLLGFLVSLVLVAATGAVTALGDTLFPVSPDVSSATAPEHFSVQLRVVHPVFACGAVLLGLAVARQHAALPQTRRLALGVGATTLLQLVLGGINVVLRAPGWLQLLHLLCAQVLWIGAVLLGFVSVRRAAQPAMPVLGPSALP